VSQNDSAGHNTQRNIAESNKKSRIINTMITLNKELIIGAGQYRDVYSHPDDDYLCIKIQRKGNNQNNLEMEYLKNNVFSFIPKFHGEIETNLGIGLVFDKVKCSGTLDSIINHDNVSILLEAFDAFWVDINSSDILMHDGGPQNVLFSQQQNGQYRVFLIDGFGLKYNTLRHRLRASLPFFRKKKTQQHLNSIGLKVKSIFNNYGVTEFKYLP
jgi:hypothetical protein